MNNFGANLDDFLNKDPYRLSDNVKALVRDVAHMFIVIAGLDHVGFKWLIVGRMNYG